MASIFSKIVNGEIPCYKVAEEHDYLAFLDISPLAKGHTLVIPKQEIPVIFDLPGNLYTGLFSFARKVAKAIEQTTGCLRVGMVVYGLDVPHAHIHLVPLTGKGNELDFTKEKVKLTPEEFAKIASEINHKFESLR